MEFSAVSKISASAPRDFGVFESPSFNRHVPRAIVPDELISAEVAEEVARIRPRRAGFGSYRTLTTPAAPVDSPQVLFAPDLRSHLIT